MPATFYTEGTFAYPNLLAGEFDRSTRKFTLLAGQNLPAGAVLGRITTSGKLTLSASGASDGSQAPTAILAEACDASAGDRECLVYESGDFNELALTLGTGHTIASIRDGLRDLSIFLHRNVGA